MRFDARRTGVVVWQAVLAILVVLGLAVWLVAARDEAPADDLAAVDTAVTDAGDVALPTAVDVYLGFTDSVRATSAMGNDHEYTASGIRHLAAAIEGVAARGGANVSAELETLRQQADRLQQNATSTEHADHVRAAFRSLAVLLRSVQQTTHPGLAAEVTAVSEAAERVRADRLLLDQREAVQTFFDRAAAALRAMSSGTAPASSART